MGEAAWVALGAVAATVLSALAAAAVVVLNARHKHAQEREAGAVSQLESIVVRQEAQIGRLEAHAQGQQQALARLYESESECESSLAEMHGWVMRYYDITTRLAEVLRGQGHEVGSLPTPPVRRPSVRRQEAEAAVRSQSHNSGILRALDRPESEAP
jgi:hypothetical protein